jgi:hypothetical protein
MAKFTLVFLIVCFLGNLSAQTTDRLPCLDKKFSVVAHIIRAQDGSPGISEASIIGAFNGASNYFKPICVSFEVCEFRYHDNFSYDVHDRDTHWLELQALYHVKNRINVYYVEDILIPEGAAGYAALGGITSMNSQGIVLKKPDNSTGVTTHELGHYFGLPHTFMGTTTTELVNGSNCATTADNICDTPADPYIEDTPDEMWVDGNCRFIYEGKDANGEYYDPLVGNIMSYYPCACEFTHEQYKRMAEVYLGGQGMW